MKAFSSFTIILLICHLLGDFHLQSQTLSDKKKLSQKHLLAHILIHAILLIYPLFLGIKAGKLSESLITIIALIFLHFLLDYTKIKLSKKLTSKNLTLFIIDQAIHFGLIILFGEILYRGAFAGIRPIYISRDYLNWALMLALVSKPANILFKLAFGKYDLKEKNPITEAGAGALIGNLERILSLIFLSLNQISAIGLIYTAKSIARFKQIEENKRFAEYYLIGTLYSILYAIVVHFLVLKI